MDWNRCSAEEALAWLRVCLVPGVPPAALRALLAWAGSPCALLRSNPREVAHVAGGEIARAFSRGADRRLVEASLRWLDARDRHLVPLDDACYPQPLLEVDHPPPILYVEGRLELLTAPALAIVGSRNASPQGLRDAESFAAAISRARLAVVSGMALGIDASAHRGALREAGSSIAILGTGPDIHYPRENEDLARALAVKGCLVSEFPLGTPPLARNFPRRNRLISGMSKGVLVVEAGFPSGTLTTARLALEQGRDVFAIPGSIHSPLSKGCHALIKAGAKLVESADDVLAELAGFRRSGSADTQTSARQPAADRGLLAVMGHDPVDVDSLCTLANLSAEQVASELLRLELDGRVAALPGGLYQRLEKRGDA